MAADTDMNLRNQVIYSVFVRQYSKEGTFDKVKEDIPRIRSLGTDIVWLMPIHPIGEVNRKGTLGSPYAIRNYRAVNPEYGTMEDFRALVDEIHANGMKCIIDVVYNHTSPDSVLSKEHPEWFYHKPDGSFGNRIGDWTDIIDLDYSKKELWAYQIDTLKIWAETVDGFRCDVAPLVPLEFWIEARRAVAEVNPEAIWLSETVEPPFICDCRAKGLICHSDSEMYQAFDITYDYDIYWDFINTVTGRESLADYAAKVSQQEAVYPENYIKLRLLENHDRMRAKHLIPDERALRSWTAFQYFQKGTALLYNGQETENTVHPGLFDRDPVDWNTGYDLSPLLRRLAEIKKMPYFREGAYRAEASGRDALTAVYRSSGRQLVGLFHTEGRTEAAVVPVPDGEYTDLITGHRLRVEAGILQTMGEPVIFETEH